jgi:hypothetical protein
LWQAFFQLGARGNENSELSCCQQQLVTPVHASYYDENYGDILLSFVVASPSLTNAVKKECSQEVSSERMHGTILGLLCGCRAETFKLLPAGRQPRRGSIHLLSVCHALRVHLRHAVSNVSFDRAFLFSASSTQGACDPMMESPISTNINLGIFLTSNHPFF